MVSHIKEANLIDSIKNGAVTAINITANESGKYQISVSLTWKTGTYPLITAKGKVRVWVSLDRLAAHMRKHYSPLPPINLVLNTENKDARKNEKGVKK